MDLAQQVECSHKEYLKWLAEEIAFLNTIDLTPYLVKGENINNIMDTIENKYGDKYKKESCIFNNMDSYDFMNYLKTKYGTKFYEVSYYEVL